jgi:IQ calmodulin-binding motif
MHTMQHLSSSVRYVLYCINNTQAAIQLASVIVLQQWWRSMKPVVLLHKQRAAAVIIQCSVRGMHARVLVYAVKHALVSRIQHQWRVHVMRCALRSSVADMKAMRDRRIRQVRPLFDTMNNAHMPCTYEFVCNDC